MKLKKWSVLYAWHVHNFPLDVMYQEYYCQAHWLESPRIIHQADILFSGVFDGASIAIICRFPEIKEFTE